MKHKIGILLVAAISIALAAPAFAQNKPAAAAPLANILQTLLTDAQAASQDAKEHNDVIAQTCYDAIVVVAQAKMSSDQVKGGALLVFQKVRDVTRLNSSPIGTSLIVGCAPLVQDAKLSFIQFFANIGGSILLKGLLVP